MKWTCFCLKFQIHLDRSCSRRVGGAWASCKSVGSGSSPRGSRLQLRFPAWHWAWGSTCLLVFTSVTWPFLVRLWGGLEQSLQDTSNSVCCVCQLLPLSLYLMEGQTSSSEEVILPWHVCFNSFRSVHFNRSVLSDSLRPHELQHARPPVHHQLPEFTLTHVHWVGDAIRPSHPLSPASPPAPNPSHHQGLSQWVSSQHQVVKVLEFQLQHQSFQSIPRTDLL